jgi:anion-transporting  ArsA/GET3 family ATPase
MQEWTMLGKAWWHTTEIRPDGSWLYDVVILDAPATGHGLDMLRVPKIILDVVPPGLLRRDAERAWKMFQNPETCAVVLVTLPEEMPTTETIELARALREELQLPLGRIVVNGVLPPLFSKEERASLAAVGPLDGLVASHLDAVEGAGLRWCAGYRTADGVSLASLPFGGDAPDLEQQQRLTQLLQGAKPLYEPDGIATPEAWIKRVEALSGRRVRYGAFGPARGAVRSLHAIGDV